MSIEDPRPQHYAVRQGLTVAQLLARHGIQNPAAHMGSLESRRRRRSAATPHHLIDTQRVEPPAGVHVDRNRFDHVRSDDSSIRQTWQTVPAPALSRQAGHRTEAPEASRRAAR
jgi:hypothetical protein